MTQFFDSQEHLWPERGAEYEHRDGRFGVLISSHPHDGACLVLNQTRHPDDEISVYFDCERCDLKPASAVLDPNQPMTLKACDQSTGKEYYIASGPRAELQAQADIENGRGRDFFLVGARGAKESK